MQNHFLAFLLLLAAFAGLIGNAPVRAQAVTQMVGATNILVVRVVLADQDEGTANLQSETSIQSAISDVISPYYQEQSYNVATVTVRMYTVELFGDTNKVQNWQTRTPEQLRTDALARLKVKYGLSDDQVNYFDLQAFQFNIPNPATGAQPWPLHYNYGIGRPYTFFNRAYGAGLIGNDYAKGIGHAKGLFSDHIWSPFADGSAIGEGESTYGINNSGTDQTTYYHPFDAMGKGGVPEAHFSAPLKNKMGWLPLGSGVRTISQPGHYEVTIRALDVPTNNPQSQGPLAIRVRRNGKRTITTGENYWIEFRRQFVSNPAVQNGVLINWDYGDTYAQAKSIDLIDTTPETKSFRYSSGTVGSIEDTFNPAAALDAPLLVGRTLSDLDATPDIHITPVSRSNNEMKVIVEVGTYQNNEAPTAEFTEIAGSSVSGTHPAATIPSPAPGEETSFHLALSDPDDTKLYYYVEYGDGSSDGGEITNVSAGLTLSHPYTDGAYEVRVVISDGKGGKAAANASLTVGTATTHKVEGFIVTLNEAGAPVPLPNAIVTAESTTGQEYFAHSDATGKYILSGIPDNTTLRLYAGLDGYEFARANIVEQNGEYVWIQWNNPVTVGTVDYPDSRGFVAAAVNPLSPYIEIKKPVDGRTITNDQFHADGISGVAHDALGGSGIRNKILVSLRDAYGRYWNWAAPPNGDWETLGTGEGEDSAPKTTATLTEPDPAPSRGADITWFLDDTSLLPDLANGTYTVTATTTNFAGYSSPHSVVFHITQSDVEPDPVDPVPGGVGTTRIDLNGPNSSGVNRSNITWTVDAAVTLPADDATVTKTQGNITKVEIAIVNRLDGTNERLTTSLDSLSEEDLEDSPVQFTFNENTGVYTLTGSATADVYQAIVKSVKYQNTATTPSGSTRSITFAAYGGVQTAYATATITKTPAPGDDDDGDDDGDDDDGDDDGPGPGDPTDDGGNGSGDSNGSSGTSSSRIDVNGKGAGFNYSAKWNKGQATNITSGDATIKETDNQVQKLLVILEGGAADATETLSASLGTYANGTLTIQGPKTRLEMETALRSVVYTSSPDASGKTKTIRFEMYGNDDTTVTSRAYTFLNTGDSGNGNNQMFTGSASVSGSTATIVYRVKNVTSTALTGVQISGLLAGGRPNTDELQDADVVASKGSASVRWTNPPSLERFLNKAKASKTIRWSIDTLDPGEVATLTITTPLRPQSGYGSQLTATWKADFPGALTDEAVDPLHTP